LEFKFTPAATRSGRPRSPAGVVEALVAAFTSGVSSAWYRFNTGDLFQRVEHSKRGITGE
jgi:hypothetical protein